MAEHPEYEGERFAQGLDNRRAVLGAEYVDKSMANADEFMRAFQKVTTEWCWGDIWGRPGLERKTRSMLNLAMLTALNRSPELKLHVRGALNNGVTREEIKEVLLHATVYCGIPAGLDAFKTAAGVFAELDAPGATAGLNAPGAPAGLNAPGAPAGLNAIGAPAGPDER